MKAINQKATKKLESILRYEGIEKVGDHAKIENNDTYTPLSIEAIWQWEDLFEEPYPEEFDPLCISLCHYGTQNGDAMRDPEVCLFRSSIEGEMKYYPYYFRNDYVGVEKKYHCPTPTEERAIQADLCQFMTTWIDNIIDQQYQGKAPRKGTTRAEEEEIERRVQEIKAQQREAIDPLETIEGQTIAIINERRREEREKKAGEKIAKIAEETREERKARLQKAREEREAIERTNAKRRDAQVDEPPIKFNTTHKKEGIKSYRARRIRPNPYRSTA